MPLKFSPALPEPFQNPAWWNVTRPATSPPSAAVVRSGVERGDPFAVIGHSPVGLAVNPGERVGAPLRPLGPAGAYVPVPNYPYSPDIEIDVVVADPDGQDSDAMEHERESRLSRWQRQPVE